MVHAYEHERIHESLRHAGADPERESLLLELFAALLSHHPRVRIAPLRSGSARQAVRRAAAFLRAHPTAA